MFGSRLGEVTIAFPPAGRLTSILLLKWFGPLALAVTWMVDGAGPAVRASAGAALTIPEEGAGATLSSAIATAMVVALMTAVEMKPPRALDTRWLMRRR